MKKILSILLLTAFSVFADPIIGKYLPPEKDSVIEMFACGSKICGRTLCIKNNAYPADSKEGVPGTPYLDHKNEDASLRTRPNLGMQFLNNFEPKGEGKYADGKIYNPRDGKTYCGKITLEGNKLDLKGHLCISSFLGKTNTWNKVDDIGFTNDKIWDCVGKKK